MTQFQKIAIGLLGLTHPEMFIPRPKAAQAPAAKIAVDRHSTEPFRPEEGQIGRMVRALRFVLTALAIGSRTVALADNSELGRDLRAAHARLLYGCLHNPAASPTERD